MHSKDICRISRREMLKMAGIGASGLVLAACQPPTAPSAPQAPAGAADVTPAPQQTEVTFTARIGTQAEHYDDFGERFMEAYPHIKYVPQHVPGTEWEQKMQVQAAGGTLPDAMWMASTRIYGPFVHKGLVIDHYPLVESHNVDLDVFYPAAIEFGTIEGKLGGMPWICHPDRIGMFYAEPMLDEAGVDYPDGTWTWQDLTEAALALTKRDGDMVEQFGFATEAHLYGWNVIIRSFGGEWLSEDGTQVLLDEPIAIKALQEGYADLISVHGVHPTPAAMEGNNAQTLAAGKLAMFQGGYWNQGALRSYAGDTPWGIAPMPMEPEGSLGSLSIDLTSVTSSARDKDAAFLFCTFMASKEAGLDIALRGSVPGARPDVWDAPELADNKTHVAFKPFMMDAEPLRIPANFTLSECFDAWGQAFDPIKLGEVSDVESVIAELAPELQGIVGRPLS